MAVTTVLFWVSLVLTVIGANALGELVILHHPASLSFSGSSTATESSIKEIFSASLGLTVEESSTWNGLVIIDPFKAPEAGVVVYIDGVSSLSNAADLKGNKYPLIADEYEPDTFDVLKHRIKQRFAGSENNLVNIALSEPQQLSRYSDVFGDIIVPKESKKTYQHLKPSVAEVKHFLRELATLAAIADKVNTDTVFADNLVDFYNFRFTSLHALSDYYGPNSLQAKEAKKLLCKELEKLTAAFAKAYDGSILVTAVTTDVVHTRRTARSLNDGGTKDSSPSVRASGYSADYAAIFNILLWFGVIYVFTLIAIVYTMIDMDPGRDSIIYRMTSTRMKKEN